MVFFYMQTIEIQEGSVVALLTETREEAPWLARVKEVEGDIVTLVWLEGGYTTKWKTARMKVGRRMVDWEDTVSRRSIILSGFRLNKNSKLDANIVKLIQDTYASCF